jgi:Methyltransferase FkbM domain
VVAVPTRCLEDLIRDNRINVLICDIEGAEIDLLMKADISRISTIMFETHHNLVTKEATDRLIERLINCGLRIDPLAPGDPIVVMRRDEYN